MAGNVPRRRSLPCEGVSTYSPSIRKKSSDDGELYMAGQGLVPVVNNPSAMNRSNSGSYGILSWPASAVDKAWAEASLPPPSPLHREVSFSDFEEYRLRVGTLMERYVVRRMSLQQDNVRRLNANEPEGSGYLRGEGLVQALRQVPSLYFQEDFSLTRPETFLQAIRGETPEERNTTLETLNNYLVGISQCRERLLKGCLKDIVETELLNEIAARSDSFFEAAESLQELQQSIGDTLFQIQRLQRHGRHIDNGMCSRAGYIQALSKKRARLEDTLELLRMVETATEAQDAVNLLLLAHDYPSALNLIESLKHQYEDDTASGMLAKGMEKLACLKQMPDALDASVVSLRGCLIGELLESLDWDEGESVLRAVAAKALGEQGRLITSARTMTEPEKEIKTEKLKQILVGLSRTGSLSDAFPEVIPHAVSRLNASLRNVMEILLPNFVHVATLEDKSPQEGSTMDQLGCISHGMFLTLLNAFYSVSAACLGHYRLLGELLLEATDNGKILQHRATVERGRSDLCQALVDTCHTQWSKLFQSRSQAHQKLSLVELKELMEMNRKCQDLATSVEVRSAHQLGPMLQPFCKAALESQHRANLTQLQQVLEQESWKLSTTDAATQEALRVTFHPTDDSASLSEERRSVLQLGGAEYRVVPTLQCLAEMICGVLKHSQSFPELITDSGRRLVELVTLFNKRSCQLVLGAQAMQASGLKSITAKHLALCSQCVLFLIHLNPLMSQALLEGCPQAKRTILQPEFDRLKQDLVLHLDGIHSKLIGIMKERVLIGIGQLREEMKSEKQSDHDASCPPSQASQQIAKQLRILTQVLTPILHEQQMTEICTSVAEIFSSELGTAFREMMEEFDIPQETVPPTEAISEEEPCVHPLEGDSTPSATESAMHHKQQLSADCQFLIEILSTLPIDESKDGVLNSLESVSQILKP